MLVLAFVFLNIHVPLSLYWLSLALNSSGMQCGGALLCALYIITVVLRSTKSSSFKVCNLIKSGCNGSL